MLKNIFKNNGNKVTAVLCIVIFLLTMTAINSDTCLASSGGNASMACNKNVAKNIVHATAQGLADILKDVKEEDKRIALIRSFIRSVRFYADQSGYFYVYKYDGINIAHAIQKDLQGKNLSDHKDGKGKYVIRELSDAAKKGGGFVEFYWVKPGDKGEHKKMGYVEPIPGTDYFIGTGVYLP